MSLKKQIEAVTNNGFSELESWTIAELKGIDAKIVFYDGKNQE